MEQRNDRMVDLQFDQIISIEEVPNTTNYAYDLTVEDTRNFDIYNGICMADQWSATGSVKSVLLPSLTRQLVGLHNQIDGELLRALATTLLLETTDRGSQLIAEPDGKKARDWVIRSQAPNLAMNLGSNTKVYDKSMGKVQRLDDCGSQMMV